MAVCKEQLPPPFIPAIVPRMSTSMAAHNSSPTTTQPILQSLPKHLDLLDPINSHLSLVGGIRHVEPDIHPRTHLPAADHPHRPHVRIHSPATILQSNHKLLTYRKRMGMEMDIHEEASRQTPASQCHHQLRTRRCISPTWRMSCGRSHWSLQGLSGGRWNLKIR